MLKKRVIPILTFNGSSLIKTKCFSNPRTIGNPIQSARVFNARNVDELVFIDITATYEKRKINLDLVKFVIDECFMPVTIGGGISNIDDIKNLLNIGADKIVLNNAFIQNEEFVRNAIKYFGSQCISASIDIEIINEEFYIRNNFNKKIKASEFLIYLNELKVGEIILNSVENDGTMKGFNLILAEFILDKIHSPIVFVGGAGKIEDVEDLYKTGYDGDIGISSLFYYSQFTPNDVKRKMKEIGLPVRFNYTKIDSKAF